MKKTGKKYKVAVIGCGAIGALFDLDPKRPKPASHAGAAAHSKHARLCALIDTDPKRLAAAAKLFPGVSASIDIQKGLEEAKPDIVAIATPPATHLPIIRACIAAKVKAIICEKPLASNTKDARAIERLLKKSNIVFVLNYQRRFFPQFRSVRSALRRGTMGRIEQISCYYSNGVHGNASHLIDALAFLLGDPIAYVVANASTNPVADPKNDRTIDALMRTKGGIAITLQGVDQAKWGINEIRIYGEKGAIIISKYGYTVSFVPLKNSVFVGVRELAFDKARSYTQHVSMVSGALRHAIECVERGKETESGVQNGRYVEAVLEALEKSASNDSKKAKVVH